MLFVHLDCLVASCSRLEKPVKIFALWLLVISTNAVQHEDCIQISSQRRFLQLRWSKLSVHSVLITPEGSLVLQYNVGLGC